jgi:hypothetical protein
LFKHPFEYLLKLNEDKAQRDKRLLLWYFESMLKVKYLNFIKELQVIYSQLTGMIN